MENVNCKFESGPDERAEARDILCTALAFDLDCDVACAELEGERSIILVQAIRGDRRSPWVRISKEACATEGKALPILRAMVKLLQGSVGCKSFVPPLVQEDLPL